MRIKKLKMQDQASIRKAVQHIMRHKLKQWWTPTQMQAAMWRVGAKVTCAEVHLIMDDLYEESQDNPNSTYQRDLPCLCYRCIAYFTPNL